VADAEETKTEGASKKRAYGANRHNVEKQTATAAAHVAEEGKEDAALLSAQEGNEGRMSPSDIRIFTKDEAAEIRNVKESDEF